MERSYHGQVNGHIIGRVLKEAVRRATVKIRDERGTIIVTAKPGYDGSGELNDVRTQGDTEAQAIYLRTFVECFPDYGVVGEENELHIAPQNGCTMYFTVDPLDGTRAYIREQSDGVGTMIALVDGQEIPSSYVGDINTEEVYGYRPGSNHVHRITRLDTFKELRYEPKKLFDGYVLLRDPADTHYSLSSQRLIHRFRGQQVIGSSIGIWAARLWKNEVAALLMPPGNETPWDSTPVIGISQKLGYEFLRRNENDVWVPYTPHISQTVYKRDHETLIVHRSALDQLV